MKFERHTGFYGSALRGWIDNNLPRCPFCKTPSLWEYVRKIGFTPSSDRFHFRCPNCMSIISIATIVTGLSDGAFLFNPIHQIAKRNTSKDFRIESVGNNEKLNHLVGSKYPLEILQEWARQIHE